MRVPENVKVGDILRREIEPPPGFPTTKRVTQEVRVIAVLDDRITVDTMESDTEKRFAVAAGAAVHGEYLRPEDADISSLTWDYSRETGEIVDPGRVLSRII